MAEHSVDHTTAAVPLLSGSLHRSLLWLALPALGEQMLNYCVGLFDTFLAGQVTAGPEAGLSTAAVGIGAYASWLASLLFVLVGTGTTALIARAWGTYNFDEGNRIANWSMPLAAVLGIAVSGLLYLMAPAYASLQHMQGHAHGVVVHYLRMDALGEAMYVFCIVGSAALRGAGDMRTPMLVLGLVNLFNIFLSTALVFGWGPFPRLGLDGVVMGTVISRWIGGLLILTALSIGISGLKLRLSLMRPSWADALRIMRIGIPQVVDGILMWLGHSVFLSIIAHLDSPAVPGSLPIVDSWLRLFSGQGVPSPPPAAETPHKAYMAAHMIAIQVEALTYLPATAWGYAAATLIGQNLGAGKFGRAMRAGHAAALQCSVVAIGGALVYLFGAGWIYRVMTIDESVRAIGVPAMQFLALYQLPLVVMIVYIFAMRGAGDTRAPMVINTLGILGLRLPVGYFGALVLHGGLIGAWSGMFVDVFARCLLALWWFRKGHWSRVKV